MRTKSKTRDRTDEVLIVSNSEDNPSPYTITLYFHRPHFVSHKSDRLLVESPSLLGDERIFLDVVGDYQLSVSTANYLVSIPKLQMALLLVQRHEQEIIKAMTK